MIGFIPAVAMFRRGDVKAARQCVVVPFDREQELNSINYGGSGWQPVDTQGEGQQDQP